MVKSHVQSLVSLLLVAMLTLSLSSCGFKLRGYDQGAGGMSFKSAKLEQNGAKREVYRALELFLKESNVEVTDSLTEAELLIRLDKTGYQRSTTAKNAAGDTSSELIKMTQPFSVKIIETEKALLDDAEATAYRDRGVNANQAQASSRELRTIQRQMADELALQILDRVNRSYAPGLKQ